jgi:hypothetical protein
MAWFTAVPMALCLAPAGLRCAGLGA